MIASPRLLAPLLLLLLSGCALFERPDHYESREITFADLPGWADDDHGEALEAFKKSCPILAKSPRPATVGSGIAVSAKTWESLCKKAAHTTSPRQFFEENFTPFQVSNWGNERGLFTGYYEPLLYGSLKKQGDFIYPVYGAPSGLADKKPYLTREEIDNGALAGKGLEIVWVDDPVMLFFMQIQGSGRIRLNNHSEFIAAYADQNGRAYVTLGKLMIDEGLLEKGNVNFFTVRQWLYDHHNRKVGMGVEKSSPERGDFTPRSERNTHQESSILDVQKIDDHQDEAIAMMQRNPSYVFFKRQDSLDVVGAIAAPLTPKRSLAVDNKYIPYGLPLYLDTTLPELPGVPSHPFQRLVIAQDTGGAIKKPVRGDVFFGHGQEAEYLAGFMKQQGRYALLVPK